MGNEGLTFDMISNMSDNKDDNINQENFDAENQQTEDAPFIEDLGNYFANQADAAKDGAIVLDDDSEGVGNEDGQEGEEGSSDGADGNSPTQFTSIANALKEDGILNLLDETDLKNIKDADDLAAAFQKQIEGMLSDQQKRVKEALDVGIPKDQVSEYEQVINYIHSIKEDAVEAETPEAEQLRSQILMQDYLNMGFSQERATREVQKSFNAGTDVDDAKSALESLNKHYDKQYKDAVKSAADAQKEKVKAEKEQSKKIEKLFLETEEPVKGFKLSEVERKKILKQYSTFVDKDENGVPLNAIQKYAKENPVDYQYALHTLFYLTDGFKSLDKVVNKEVQKKTRSALNQLEKQLNNPSNAVGVGGLDFGNDRSKDSYDGLQIVFD